MKKISILLIALVAILSGCSDKQVVESNEKQFLSSEEINSILSDKVDTRDPDTRGRMEECSILISCTRAGCLWEYVRGHGVGHLAYEKAVKRGTGEFEKGDRRIMA